MRVGHFRFTSFKISLTFFHTKTLVTITNGINFAPGNSSKRPINISIMISAKDIRNGRKDEWQRTFDFPSFDKYIEDEFKKPSTTSVEIGCKTDWIVKSWADKNGRDCKTLAFEKGRECYIWKTDIQVAYSIEDFVAAYLRECGFKVTCKGACGYEEYDLIVVTL